MKTLLMWLLCPRYFKDFPKHDEPGQWVACSIRQHLFGGSEEYELRDVEGLRKAYKVARWLALRADWSLSPRVWGISWGVRRPKEHEIKPTLCQPEDQAKTA